MILVELTTNHDLKPFDCGDADLNGFLMDNAKLFAEKRIGKTFLLMDGDVIAAYFCLFNDKISRLEASNSAWRKVNLLSTIDCIDERDTGLLKKLVAAVKNILSQNSSASAKDEITPYVDSMKIGMKLPADLDIKALREEHINKKYS